MEFAALFSHGDGGAFPEVHVQQFPLGLGLPHAHTEQRLAIRVDDEGKVDFTSILGTKKGQTVFAKPEDLEEQDEDSIPQRPSAEDMAKVANETRQSLEKIVSGHTQAAAPSHPIPQRGEAQYIKYTPNNPLSTQIAQKQRIIRMVAAPTDPLDPPKFKARKQPKGPGEAPVPILHSPPRKVTAQEQQEWKIPPCLSNWKNPRGYTIPLDKRLAADGRTLQEVTLNDKFATMAEALAVAERVAREENEKRNALQTRLLQAEQQKKEADLLAAAQARRLARVGNAPEPVATARADADMKPQIPVGDTKAGISTDDKEAHARDVLREERKRLRERENRIEAARETRTAEATGEGSKRSRPSRDKDRDISERIVLGQGPSGASGDAMYDQRLFNQTEGLGSGFGAEDDYNIFSKPLFAGTSAQIYRPARAGDTDRNVSKPVEFERDSGKPRQPEGEQEDPFHLDTLMDKAKKGRGRE
ncbi:putative SNW/SKI-interacting protein A [Paratrimastix pyriformis]|uniref:SNW/SKI-interacting protein A n=1 Tax=Paratrimastix pyriformis TaxID=342808 RepID=A0ABQ8UUV9_9EUKA|nr:putative SNW/SKI-interacting protein A [Paratrimastix pyriformis]